MDPSYKPTKGTESIEYFHYLAPLFIFLVYIFASLAHVVFSARKAVEKEKSKDTQQKTVSNISDGREARLTSTALFLTSAVSLLYLVEAIVLISYATSEKLASPDDAILYNLYLTLIWSVLYLGLTNKNDGATWYPFLNSWATDFAFSAVIFGLGFFGTTLPRGAKIARTILQILRLCLVAALLAIKPVATWWALRTRPVDEETAPLLTSDDETARDSLTHSNGYGALNDNNGHAVQENGGSNPSDQNAKDTATDEDDEDQDEEDSYRSSPKMKKHWWLYVRSFALFFPYFWPSGNRRLQLHFLGISICLGFTRLFNILIPVQLGLIVNKLANDQKGVPWREIVIFIVLRLLNSSGGISLIQDYLWLSLEKDSLSRLSCASYDHVMGLSCDFHAGKRSGRMWQTMSRGQSIVSLVRAVFFDMLPMLIDLTIAICVFYWLFDAYMAFIGMVVVVLVLYSTQAAISKKSKGQRKFIKLWEAAYDRVTESSLNWMTVSYFNRIRFESERFKDAVNAEKEAWIVYRMISNALMALRSVLLIVGLLAALLLAACQVKLGEKQVGDFVTLITYWAQLGTPLAYLASGFSKIVEDLVDSERLLDLLKTQPSIQDRPDAKEFNLRQGEVTFENVKFSYDKEREVLKGIDFKALPGRTIALVGESGGGKSTILKLLFRFYDVSDGSIKIDGQDLRYVTQHSFREHIGVVPQDVALFNKSVLENLQYAKLDATEDECQAACKAVALHDKIMSFPKRYNTLVGERGVKMSGGELQRMAIARVLLKDPKIILLDEATSSVDSETEATIQHSLARLTKGKTTFVIAHRLSTIVNADLVLVIKQGVIAERGSHAQLLKAKGHYHQLWSHQIKLDSGNSRSRSQSPTKAPAPAPVFVNDLDLSTTNGEGEGQAKSTAHKASHSNIRRNQSPGENTRFRLGSSAGRGWKPEAPEFVPAKANSSISAAQPATASASDAIAKGRSQNSSKAKSSSALPLLGPDKAPRRWRKDKGNRTNIAEDQGSTSRTIAESEALPSAEQTTKNTSIQESDEPRDLRSKPKRRRTLFRRRDSKSEPTNQSIANNTDGAFDGSTEYAIDNNHQGSRAVRPQRTVSMPAEYAQSREQEVGSGNSSDEEEDESDSFSPA